MTEPFAKMGPYEKTAFNIVICGAGIAGLCAGIGLARQCHNITILESAHELTSNATLVLKHFDLLERLSNDALLPASPTFRRWDNNKILAGSHEPESAETPSAAIDEAP